MKSMFLLLLALAAACSSRQAGDSQARPSNATEILDLETVKALATAADSARACVFAPEKTGFQSNLSTFDSLPVQQSKFLTGEEKRQLLALLNQVEEDSIRVKNCVVQPSVGVRFYGKGESLDWVADLNCHEWYFQQGGKWLRFDANSVQAETTALFRRWFQK